VLQTFIKGNTWIPPPTDTLLNLSFILVDDYAMRRKDSRLRW